MLGSISEDGFLHIHRGKTVKRQTCPHARHDWLHIYCGDWCPKFGEPFTSNLYKKNRVVLYICDSTELVFDVLVDNRG